MGWFVCWTADAVDVLVVDEQGTAHGTRTPRTEDADVWTGTGHWRPDVRRCGPCVAGRRSGGGGASIRIPVRHWRSVGNDVVVGQWNGSTPSSGGRARVAAPCFLVASSGGLGNDESQSALMCSCKSNRFRRVKNSLARNGTLLLLFSFTNLGSF